MPSIISSLALFAIAVAFIFLVIYLIRLSKSAQGMLESLDEVLFKSQAAIDSTLAQFNPVISKLSELEDTAQGTLDGINQRMALIENQLIPLLEELRNTTKAYQDLGRAFEKDLPPILDNVHQITGDIQELTGDIKVKIQQTQDFFEAAREVSENVRVATNIGRSGLSGLAVQVASMTTGIKTSLEFLSENLRFKGGSKK
ncbi:MAG: DUF948 domain-containing protein [Deltaproteobacteria bacterium]|nr:DUF948 domain-containing protein [Deltaproteobacteria bacterium]MBW1718791.1 DUF948 domain-containing protein [Deltaproteobacteria bacterium]MBW1931881.1 DUF948 domain-containing protein [Deltaproteobacteria bacterium]MBW1937535.1 DUF948 domain-containing protein [Deltaproteobacteria bacterium]MBW1964111.1 DUF948 domain-containing protein [Deltaproteobacteria bacterium]